MKSSLCQKEIFFGTYDAGELRAVLRQRARIAFADDALDDGVIPLCAAYGRKQSGDAREALDLLRAAGDIARNEGREHVQEADVEEGRDRVQREEVIEGVRTLHDHSHYALYALCTLAEEDATPARTRNVYTRYKQVCQMEMSDPLTSRRVRDFLQELAMLGALNIKEQNKGMSGGQYYEFELAHQIESMLLALEDTIGNIGMYESLDEYAA